MVTDTAQATDQVAIWPSTQEALDGLIKEIARLRADLSALTGQGMEEGAYRLDVAVAERRLQTLDGVVSRCRVVDDTHAVAIGRRATVEDRDGVTASYRVVAPSDDPGDGGISAESPLGRAILGARRGDIADVHTPAGVRSVVVVSVE